MPRCNTPSTGEGSASPPGRGPKSYDFGNRSVRKVLDSNGDGTTDGSTIFVYDGNQIALQLDKTGTGAAAATDLSHRYLFGTAVDQILADEQLHYDSGQSSFMTDEVLFPLTDHLGTVRDVLDTSSTVRIHRAYDAFGNVTSAQLRNASNQIVTPGQPGALLELFGFTGKPFDLDTGLQNNLNRWYDAAVGRWMSEDYEGFIAGDANLYRYVGNSPALYTDSLGLVPDEIRGQRGGPASLIGNICYYDASESIFTRDATYPAGLRAGFVVSYGDGHYFYKDLELAARSDEIDSEDDFESFIKAAQKRYEFYQLLGKVVKYLNYNARNAGLERDRLQYQEMVKVISAEYYGGRNNPGVSAIEKWHDAIGAAQGAVGAVKKYMKRTGLNSLDVTFGGRQQAGEWLGTIRYATGSADVTWHYPDWMVRRAGGVTISGEQVARAVDYAAQGLEIAGGLLQTAGSLASDDPASALRGFQGLITVMGALSGRVGSAYFDTLSSGIDAMLEATRALHNFQYIMNAKDIMTSFSNPGPHGGPFGSAETPLSVPWFTERSATLRREWSR